MMLRPTGQAVGPYDAAFLPRLEMIFREPEGPVAQPVTKFGGQPVWLEEPAWPVEPRTGEPLTFVAQFRVPGEEVRLAYLFLDAEEGGFEANSGDAVVLVQPGGRVPSFAVIGPPDTQGPSLWRRGESGETIPVEWLVDLTPVSPESDAEADVHAAWSMYMRGEGPEMDPPSGRGPGDFLGGAPVLPNCWVRGLDDGCWQFLCQFTDRGECPGDPFSINFGYGSGFVFLSPDHLEGRFMSDCD
ncbi:hypothetical protein [Streptomyces sp. NPDC002640]